MRLKVRSGIAVDECAHCHGAWLDAGEFDAVRSALLESGTPPPPRQAKNEGSGWTALDFIGEAGSQLLIGLLDGI